MEEVIYRGRWSTGIKRESEFNKYLKYPNEEAMRREREYAKLAGQLEIPTPKVISSGFCNERKQYYIGYQYFNLKQIPSEALLNKKVFAQIQQVLDKMGSYNKANEDTYWSKTLIREFENIMDYLKKGNMVNQEIIESIDNTKRFLKSLRPQVFIHGDFSLENIYYGQEQIIIVDYQHGCMGPEGWDKCYLFATVGPLVIPQEQLQILSLKEICMIMCIAQIRVGRSIRKNEKIQERCYLLRQWEDFLCRKGIKYENIISST